VLLATGRSSVCVSGQTSSLASLGIGAGKWDLPMCLAAKGGLSTISLSGFLKMNSRDLNVSP